jgi:hypothetical protein
MTDTSPDVARLAGAVTGLFDGPIMRHRPPVWRAWTPDGLLLLFESEHEDVARLLVVLLSSQLGSRPVLLESPDGATGTTATGAGKRRRTTIATNISRTTRTLPRRGACG